MRWEWRVKKICVEILYRDGVVPKSRHVARTRSPTQHVAVPVQNEVTCAAIHTIAICSR